MDAILVERDYKGQYERYALTPEEFKEEFSQYLVEGMPEPKEIGSSYTLSSLVHVWYTAVEVDDERWNQFFTDMKWMLPESDIEAGNLAYIREDLFQSLKEYVLENTKKSYRFTVDYLQNGQQKSFQIGIFTDEKPDSVWLAQKISNYFSAHYNGSVEQAISSVEGIDVQISDANGEYVDFDEVYGDDLKALFEHLKKDKPKLDNLISNAQQKADEKKTWIEEKREELSEKPRSEWTEEDWEAHNYCENVTAEADYFDSLDDR